MDTNSQSKSVSVRMQEQLQPFVKTRQEVRHIRKLLALHLSIQLDSSEKCIPLALSSGRVDFASTDSWNSGLHKEYMECLEANKMALEQYERLRARATASRMPVAAQHVGNIEDYLQLVRTRQQMERLRVLQDHVTRFARRLDAMHLALQGLVGARSGDDLQRLVESNPRGTGLSSSGPDDTEHQSVIRRLEKAVLYAKSRLRNEQQDLASLKTTVSDDDVTIRNKTYALSRTRDALIDWVEEALDELGDEEIKDIEPGNDELTKTSHGIAISTTQINEHYQYYVGARKRLLQQQSTSIRPEQQSKRMSDPQDDVLRTASKIPWNLVPFLSTMTTVSAMQKALLQQRLHTSADLSTKSRETLRVLDHLANESHMLTDHPLPPTQAHATISAASFAASTQPDVSMRLTSVVRAWSNAATESSTRTKDSVLEQFDDASDALEKTRRAIDSVNDMLGVKNGEETFDIWSSIDGNVGVLIKNE